MAWKSKIDLEISMVMLAKHERIPTDHEGNYVLRQWGSVKLALPIEWIMENENG